MIESRYTIEYVNPESKKESGVKKSVALFSFLGLILATALVYAFFSITKSNDFVRVPETIQTQPVDIVDDEDDNENDELASIPIATKQEISTSTENTLKQKTAKPSQKNKEKSLKTTEQIITNRALNDSINNLTNQLMAERERRKALDKRLNSQKNQSNQLSELLENALSKASSADKNYLKALNTLEKKSKSVKLTTVQKNKTKKSVDSTIRITSIETKDTKKAGSYNSISLSTNSQIDAIIAAMQGNNTTPSKIIKTSVDKTNEVQLASVSQTNPTELLHIQLQKQINQLIKKKEKNTSPTSNKIYSKALEKESKVRKNAVRSITIKKGETLWAIAQRAYGNGVFYKKIIKANPQINVNKLYVGQIIRVPN